MMKIRVLLVDDEKDFVDVLADRLRARKIYAVTTYSGEEALERLQHEEMDVVILDLQMPIRDGLDILKEIKQISPLTEVILLTGHGKLDSAIAAIQQGAFYYLMKPTNMKELLENIANAFKRKSEQEERIRRAEINRILLAAVDAEVA